MLRRGFHAPRLGPCSDVERGFQLSRLGALLMTMISLASGVWILLFDDLSSVIFRQPTGGEEKEKTFWTFHQRCVKKNNDKLVINFVVLSSFFGVEISAPQMEGVLCILFSSLPTIGIRASRKKLTKKGI